MAKVDTGGGSIPRGDLSFKLIRPIKKGMQDLYHNGFPHRGLPNEVNKWRESNVPNLMRGVKPILGAMVGLAPTISDLHLTRLRILAPDRMMRELYEEWKSNHEENGDYPEWARSKGFGLETMEFGLASLRMVTTAGVVKIVADAFVAGTALNFKFHGFGTGSVAEAIGDTALTTELTTQYVVDNTRPTGSQATGGSSNVYRTIATLSPDTGGTLAITEHGIFSAASSVTLLDKSIFSAVNLVAGSDSLQTTYDLTVAAGG